MRQWDVHLISGYRCFIIDAIDTVREIEFSQVVIWRRGDLSNARADITGFLATQGATLFAIEAAEDPDVAETNIPPAWRTLENEKFGVAAASPRIYDTSAKKGRDI